MTANKQPTVIEALNSVMSDVQAIKKDDRNTQQNYSFRGVDAVVNAVGPALRRHGVIVVPVAASCESEHYTTARGTPMRGVTLTVSFRFYGPAGDSIDATVCGEASDSGDKAVPKAHSVAYRTLLLEALCIPTDEPDPDEETYVRAPDVVHDDDPETGEAEPSSDRPATDPQRKRMFAIANEKGMSADDLKAIVVGLTQKTSTKDLTMAEMKVIFDALDSWTTGDE